MRINSMVALVLCFIVASCHKDAEDSYIDHHSGIVANEKLQKENLEQNRWIYDAMFENYYWYKEMPVASMVDFTMQAQPFFTSLLWQNDRFSWIEPYNRSSRFSMYDNYGIEFQTFKDAVSQTIHRVLLVVPNSAAHQAGVNRGDWFALPANNESGITGTLVIENGVIENNKFLACFKTTLFASVHSSHTEAVQLDTIYTIGERKIGYLFYNSFEDAAGTISNPYKMELRNIFARYKQENISEFIIDLRYNPGGYVSICQYLCGLILPDEYLGEISGYHEFNDKLAKILLESTGNKEEVLNFPDLSTIGGINIGIRKIYAIVSGRSFSASESLINSLDPFIEVVRVGTTTGGKGLGSNTIQNNMYKWQIQPITFRYYNKDHFSVPDTGLVPDIPADEILNEVIYEIGDTREYLLNVAIIDIIGNKTKSSVENQKMTIRPHQIPDVTNRSTQGLINQ